MSDNSNDLLAYLIARIEVLEMVVLQLHDRATFVTQSEELRMTVQNNDPNCETLYASMDQRIQWAKERLRQSEESETSS